MLYGAVLTAVLVSPATATRTRDATTPALEVYVSTGVSPLRAGCGRSFAGRSDADRAGRARRLRLRRLGCSARRAAYVAFSFNDASPTGGGGAFSRTSPLLSTMPLPILLDPAARICAPGTHAAAWSGTTSVAGQTFRCSRRGSRAERRRYGDLLPFGSVRNLADEREPHVLCRPTGDHADGAGHVHVARPGHTARRRSVRAARRFDPPVVPDARRRTT